VKQVRQFILKKTDPRKRIYLPSTTSTNKDNSTKEVEDENNIRKELENEFAEISGGNFSDLVDEVRKEESKTS